MGLFAGETSAGSTKWSGIEGDRKLGPRIPFLLSLVAALGLLLSVGASVSAAAAPIIQIDPNPTASYTTAQVTGTIDPQGDEILFGAEYSTDDASWTQVFTEFLPSSSGVQPVSVQLTGLIPGTSYFVRLAAVDFTNFGEFHSSAPDPKLTTLATAAPMVTIDPPSEISPTTARFSGQIDPNGTDPAFDVHWRFECTPACPGLEGTVPAGNTPVAVSAESSTLQPGADYEVSLVAENLGANATAGPLTFDMPATAAPFASTEPASGRRSQGITLNGSVIPQGNQTTYRFEYGPDTAYGKSIPLSEGVVGRGFASVFVSQTVAGLMPGTTYHFRLVASSSQGTKFGEDRTFSTLSTEPSNRGYEQVTPVDHEGGTVDPLIGFQAEQHGNGLIYQYVNDPAAGGEAAPRASRFMAVRGAEGWSTLRQLDPPLGIPLEGGGLFFSTIAVSSDFSEAYVVSDRALSPGAQNGAANLYLRNAADGSYRLMASSNYPGAFREFVNIIASGAKGFIAGSPNFSWIAFNSPVPLLPGAPTNTDYIWSEEGGLKAEPGLGYPSSGGSLFYYAGQESAPGIFFQDSSGSIPISISEVAGEPTEPQPGVVLAVSPDGGKALFYVSSNVPLTVGAPAASGDVYRYARATGDLTYVEGGTGEEVLALTPDTGIVYFGHEVTNTDHQFNVNSEGAVETIASYPDRANAITMGTSMSPNGRYLAYRLGELDLSGGEFPTANVYVYDSWLKEASCASCPPPGVTQTEEARMFDSELAISSRHPQAITNEGEVFFDTPSALVSSDTNGLRDVYAFKDGAVHLISPGTGPYEARFADSANDGEDVFIATSQGLVRRDQNKVLDIYDARVGGGFAAEDAVPAPACVAEACQPEPGSPPGSPSLGTATVGGRSGPARGLIKVAGKVAVHGASASIAVTVSGRGRISGGGGRLKKVNRPVGKAGKYVIGMALTNRAQKQLMRAGRLKVSTSLTFRPEHGDDSSIRLTIPFNREGEGR